MNGLLNIALFFPFLILSPRPGHYPQHDFISPTKYDIRLSGTFGELRSNHFHAGLDIKSSKGVSGDTVYAAADGYIGRISVQEFGYGNALYIHHPNGFTTVYGHLDHFAPGIQAWVKQQQYKTESFEVDLKPEPFLFPVRQGEVIAIMGNTGYSAGPHLHFEIRHTESQLPVNPLHFGLPVYDHRMPVLQKLIAYQYDPSGRLLSSTAYKPRRVSDGEYVLDNPVEIAGAMANFAVEAFDYQDGSDNHNGLYSLSFKADDEPSFGFAMDEIPFRDMRYLNAHIDYRLRVYQNDYVHRCFLVEGNKLPIYFTGVDRGTVFLNTELPRAIDIEMSDFSNNTTSLKFEVIRNNFLLLSAPAQPAGQANGNPDQVAIIDQPGIHVVWPKGSFYEKTPLYIQPLEEKDNKAFSPQYELNPTDIPVHYYFDISILGNEVPDSLKDKAFIARIESTGQLVSVGGKWVGQNLTADARQMGTYMIRLDTVPPAIKAVKFSSRMTGWAKMEFDISDNFGTRDRARDLIYNAKVDGQWILMALDGKSGRLTHEFDGRIAPGAHELVLTVTDDRGNATVLQKSFTL